MGKRQSRVYDDIRTSIAEPSVDLRIRVERVVDGDHWVPVDVELGGKSDQSLKMLFSRQEEDDDDRQGTQGGSTPS